MAVKVISSTKTTRSSCGEDIPNCITFPNYMTKFMQEDKLNVKQLSLKQCKTMQDKFKDTHPDIAAWYAKVQNRLIERGMTRHINTKDSGKVKCAGCYETVRKLNAVVLGLTLDNKVHYVALCRDCMEKGMEILNSNKYNGERDETITTGIK